METMIMTVIGNKKEREREREREMIMMTETGN